MIFVGNDWAQDHHDVCVIDAEGSILAESRFDEGIEGLTKFHALLGGFVSEPADVIVGVETDRGLWVEALLAAGYQVYAVNPKSVSRYRDRLGVSGAKSDRGDAKVLADMVRTDRHLHRQVAGDSDLGHDIKLVARVHQTLIWDRLRHVNRLRAALREFYPQAVAMLDVCPLRDGVAVLEAAPDPVRGTKLTKSQIVKALKRGGRQRNLETTAHKIQEMLRGGYLEASPGVIAGLSVTTTATAAIIKTINDQIALVEAELAPRFEQHPDAAIYLSMPGCGVTLGARMLGEFGDEPERYIDAKARKNYAATSPVTIASGNYRNVKARWVRNDRLHDAVMQWARLAICNSPGARAMYDEQRGKGAGYHKAIRAVANKLVGCLHGCLKAGTLYDEEAAWAHRQTKETQKAA
ncbi:MAG: IS110 family transposase [Acidimicrobiia bacterium]